MEGVPVDLYDRPLGSPEEIDLVAPDLHVRLRVAKRRA